MAALSARHGRRRVLRPQRAGARASARSACWSRSSRPATRRSWRRFGKQLAMHVAAANPQCARHRRRRSGGASSASATCWREQARGLRQAGGDHRQDGRRPAAQVLRGSRCCWSRSSSSTARARSARWSRRRPRRSARRSRSPASSAMALGEGIERASRSDFAAEVAAQLGGYQGGRIRDPRRRSPGGRRQPGGGVSDHGGSAG